MREVIMKHRTKITYLIVGGWNTLFGYASFSILYFFLSQRLNPAFILTISYVLSITNAFIGYKAYVFRTRGNVLREYLRFYVVYAGAYVANLILLPVLMGALLLNVYIAQGLIVFITVITSYIIHKRFTFNMHEHKK